jgi:septum formation protein
MSETQTALVLASSSPRRRDLLGRLHVAPTRIASPDIDETPRKGEVPRVYALRMAVEKARAVERLPGEIVIAGDTTWRLAAACSTRRDAEDVRAMLGKLAGRRHRVFAGVRDRCGGRQKSRLSETIVTFKSLSQAEIEPMSPAARAWARRVAMPFRVWPKR